MNRMSTTVLAARARFGPLIADSCVVGTSFLVAVAAILSSPRWTESPRWLVVVAGLLGTAVLIGRRRWPVLVTLLGIAVYLLSENPIALVAGLYTTAVRARDVWLVGTATLAAVGFATYDAISHGQVNPGSIVSGVVLTALIVAVGAYVGARRDLLASLRERAERAVQTLSVRARLRQPRIDLAAAYARGLRPFWRQHRCAVDTTLPGPYTARYRPDEWRALSRGGPAVLVVLVYRQHPLTAEPGVRRHRPSDDRRELARLLALFSDRDPEVLRRGLVWLDPCDLPDVASRMPDGPVSFVAASCQYPAGVLDATPNRLGGGPVGPADASMRRLAHALDPGHGADRPSLLLLNGDQVYIDSTAGLFDPRRQRLEGAAGDAAMQAESLLRNALKPASDPLFGTAPASGTSYNANNDPKLRYTDPNNPGTTIANPLAQQMQVVARIIEASGNADVGAKRQVFFVSLGGFDTHDDQNQNHADLLARVAHALRYFDTVLGAIGARNSVTTFTASDLGRSFTSNGDGTDHGWGSHHLVMGGAVRGGDLYGRFPTLGVKNAGNNNFDSSPDQLANGCLLPGTSVDQLGATLGRWFGLSDPQVMDIFPNLANFDVRDLGFMA